MSGAVIAGVGMHPFGRYPDKTPEAMSLQAIQAALDDAGLSYPDIQLVLCGKVVYKKEGEGIDLMMKLGMTGVPIYQINAMCATGGAMLRLAADAIASGSCEVVLVYGFDKHQGMFRDLGESWQNELGMKASPIAFATVAQRLQCGERRHWYRCGLGKGNVVWFGSEQALRGTNILGKAAPAAFAKHSITRLEGSHLAAHRFHNPRDICAQPIVLGLEQAIRKPHKKRIGAQFMPIQRIGARGPYFDEHLVFFRGRFGHFFQLQHIG